MFLYFWILKRKEFYVPAATPLFGMDDKVVGKKSFLYSNGGNPLLFLSGHGIMHYLVGVAKY